MNSHWYCEDLVATKAEQSGNGRAPSVIKEIMRIHNLCFRDDDSINDYDFLLLDVPNIRSLDIDRRPKDYIKTLPVSDIILFERDIIVDMPYRAPGYDGQYIDKTLSMPQSKKCVFSVAGRKDNEDAIKGLPGVWSLQGSLVFDNPQIGTKGVEHYLNILRQMNFCTKGKEADLSKMYVIEHRGLRYLILQL